MNSARPAAIVLAAMLALSACAPHAPLRPVTPEQAALTQTAGVAALRALASASPGDGADPLAATLGPRRLRATPCETHFEAAGFVARCAALTALVAHAEMRAAGGVDVPVLGEARAVIMRLSGGAAEPFLAALRAAPTKGDHLAAALLKALRDDADALYQRERAARLNRLREADSAFRRAMADAIASAAGRRAPVGGDDRIRFDAAATSAARMLARSRSPAGRHSLATHMDPMGADLDLAALEAALHRADRAIAALEAISAEWRAIAAALRAYDDQLAAAGAPGAPVTGIRAARMRAAELLRRLAPI